MAVCWFQFLKWVILMLRCVCTAWLQRYTPKEHTNCSADRLKSHQPADKWCLEYSQVFLIQIGLENRLWVDSWPWNKRHVVDTLNQPKSNRLKRVQTLFFFSLFHKTKAYLKHLSLSWMLNSPGSESWDLFHKHNQRHAFAMKHCLVGSLALILRQAQLGAILMTLTLWYTFLLPRGILPVY